MGDDEATSVSELGVSKGGDCMSDRFGSKQDVGYAWNNTRGKGSHLKKKGWNPKAIATPNFEGGIEEIKVHVFDLHCLDQAERFSQSIKDITEYVEQELDQLTGKALHDIMVPIISNTNRPNLAQGEPTMEDVDKAILQEEIKEYVEEKI